MKNVVGRVTFDEIIFHLSMPLRGTDTTLFVSFLWKVLLPTAAICAGIALLRRNGQRIRAWFSPNKEARSEARPQVWVKALQKYSGGVLACLLIAELATLCHQLSLEAYIVNRLHSSPWIEENYVVPDEKNLTWPERKRNLIYIYLESMEASYMSKEDGGFYADNYIPELTKLARQNISFSDKETKLGGVWSLMGTTWTMGAMFAQTSGLPLKIIGDVNAMSQYKTFYPGAVTLGDLLEDAGYKNILMIGSDRFFAGREIYFGEHGDYEMCDYNWAVENDKIPWDYWQYWGFEDEKLIEMAKEKLLEVSEQDEPFNLTLLTVDTHFPDGYRCRLCQNQWGHVYKDVISCASRQISQFVAWIQQQDFYENTTIILSGDHLSMASLIESEIPAEKKRTVYNCIVNAAAQPVQTQNRIFTSLDMFPTTLAALGVQIDGERLGLGTNLFSDTPTLVEEIGYDELEKNVSLHSKFFDSLAHE